MNSDKRLNKKIDQDALLEQLDQLTGSELNSFLLKLFQQRAQKADPGEVLRQYDVNRFAAETPLDPIAYKSLELEALELVKKAGFSPLILSPLTPLGTCSAVAKVDQKMVVSATRGTEVVSDLTNVMALKIARAHKSVKKTNEVLNYAATHRLVRGQAFDEPGHTAHFGIIGLASGGFDTGNYGFELDRLFQHVNYHNSLLAQMLPGRPILTRFLLKEKDHPFNDLLRARVDQGTFDYSIEFEQQEDANDYYKLVQFKTFVDHKGISFNMADGGPVDWTQRLLSNRKHRAFISGQGLEILFKIKHGMI